MRKRAHHLKRTKGRVAFHPLQAEDLHLLIATEEGKDIKEEDLTVETAEIAEEVEAEVGVEVEKAGEDTDLGEEDPEVDADPVHILHHQILRKEMKVIQSPKSKRSLVPLQLPTFHNQADPAHFLQLHSILLYFINFQVPVHYQIFHLFHIKYQLIYFCLPA